MKNAGKACNNRLYRHIRTFEKIVKNYFVILRKHLEEGVYQVSAVSASDVLKRNTDSLRCAVENDVFDSLPQDSLLNELEMGD